MWDEKLIDVTALMEVLEKFAEERQWAPFHTGRNLVLALTGEVGELAEIFQWKTDEQVQQLSENPAEFVHLQEEIADVLLYLVRLSMVMKVDLDQAVKDKIKKNAAKYPAGVSGL